MVKWLLCLLQSERKDATHTKWPINDGETRQLVSPTNSKHLIDPWDIHAFLHLLLLQTFCYCMEESINLSINGVVFGFVAGGAMVRSALYVMKRTVWGTNQYARLVWMLYVDPRLITLIVVLSVCLKLCGESVVTNHSATFPFLAITQWGETGPPTEQKRIAIWNKKCLTWVVLQKEM